MVAFINRTAQGNAGSLQSANVVAEIHQQIRLCGNLLRLDANSVSNAMRVRELTEASRKQTGCALQTNA